jgi:hypothetical protein
MRRLVIEPRSLRASGFRLLVPADDGRPNAVDPPPHRTLVSRVESFADSHVAGSLVDGRLRLMVRLAP